MGIRATSVKWSLHMLTVYKVRRNTRGLTLLWELFPQEGSGDTCDMYYKVRMSFVDNHNVFVCQLLRGNAGKSEIGRKGVRERLR